MNAIGTKSLLASAILLALPAFASAAEIHGRVTAIDNVHEDGKNTGAGAVLGGVVGGVVGHQVGNGRGNTVATVAGALGGAVVGNEIEKDRKSGTDYYRVSVHFRDGRDVTYRLNSVGDLHVGDRVRADSDGRIERD